MEEFKTHLPLLIDHANFLMRINGEDDFVALSTVLLKPGFYELMHHVARALNDAELKGEYLMKVEVIVHAEPAEES
jgi:hypothetical protein